MKTPVWLGFPSAIARLFIAGKSQKQVTFVSRAKSFVLLLDGADKPNGFMGKI